MAGLGEEKTYRYLSRPIEELIKSQGCEKKQDAIQRPILGSGYVNCSSEELCIASCDVLIVGSGYGGSIAADILADAVNPNSNSPIRLVVLERGKEHAIGEFSESFGDIPGDVRFRRDEYDDFFGNADALFDLRVHKDVSVLVGNGLGGGSLINANVALRPSTRVFQSNAWPTAFNRASELDAHFDAVKLSLRVKVPDISWMPTKYQALRRLANSVDSLCQPAPITVDLDKCTKCGNCITGCNVGAKQTLPLTVLCSAEKKGAELYTGANVLTVSRCANDQAWNVRFRRTATEKNDLRTEVFQVHAKIVILAAGTLGSTEILLRSSANNALPCSSENIGRSFSTNGDTIAFGYAGHNEVNATGKSSDEFHHDPGPTITGYATVKFGVSSSAPTATIQDAAVPKALVAIFGEIVTTGALIARYVMEREPAWYFDNRKDDPDPLAVKACAIEHSQVILTMGQDNASGRLKLTHPIYKNMAETKVCWTQEILDSAYVKVTWKDAADDNAFKRLHDKLVEKGLPQGGFDGGYYIPSPAWKPVPKEFNSVMSGEPPKGHLLTVHPLGGCPMADSAEKGVVNDLGQVFKSKTGAKCYENLYVLDGSIVPASLGVNPFLTISALSHRSAVCLREKIRAGQFHFEKHAPVSKSPPLRRAAKCKLATTRKLDTSKETILIIRERLVRAPCKWLERTSNQGAYDELLRVLQKKNPEAKLSDSMKYRMVLGIDGSVDINQWLACPDGTYIEGKVKLFLDAAGTGSGPTMHENLLFIEPVLEEHLLHVTTGKFKMRLVRDKCKKPTEPLKRTFKVWKNLGKLRGGEFQLRNFAREFKGIHFFLATKQHTMWRNLEYELKFEPIDTDPCYGIIEPFKLTGEKKLGYSPEHKNPWNALLELDLRYEGPMATEPVPFGTFRVDLNYLLKDGIPQIKQSPHMPATLLAMARVGLFAVRVMFQTHLWSFGAPEYKKSALLLPVLPKREDVKNAEFLEVYLSKDGAETTLDARTSLPHVRLARYTGNRRDRGHLLLIHGLAHGGAVFATRTIPQPMADYFVQQGYVVWVLDHSLSPALKWEPHRRPYTMDDLAEFDIPLAVNHIYAIANGQIDVFAHCIGAGAFAIATMKGALHDDQLRKSKIRRATIHAVTPWMEPSGKNLANAKLAAFYKDSLRFEDKNKAGFDPIPPIDRNKVEPEFTQVLIDRIAGSIPWTTPAGNSHSGYHTKNSMSKAICDRMTFWYGYEWNHHNLSPETISQISSLVGFGNLEIFKHIYFCILRRRLTNRQGNNVYLVDDNLQDYWLFDTMFLHGEDNQVFSPRGSKTSAWKMNLTTLQFKVENCHYRKPAIWHCKVQGYGHMDMLFGKQAFQDVFPAIDHFVAVDLTQVHPKDPKDKYLKIAKACIDLNPGRQFHSGKPGKSPLVGHIIFNRVTDATGKFRARNWVEPDTFALSRPKNLRNNIESGDSQKNAAGPLDQHLTMSTEYQFGEYWLQDIKNLAPNYSLQVERKSPERVLSVANDEGTDQDSDKCTNVDNNNRSIFAFALGSCRHPGSPFERDSSDAVFGEIFHQANQGKLSLALMLGDQIYADATAEVFDTSESGERYWQRYRDAFTTPEMKKLLKCLPTYFAVDDHEFEDNWLGDKTIDCDPNSRRNTFRYARDAARSYQGLAGYRKGDYKFWYEIKDVPYSFFVLDTRTKRTARHADVSAGQCEICDPEQWQAFENWLLNQHPTKPKFIACGSPIAPMAGLFKFRESWRNEDGWLGFPKSLERLIALIVKKEIKNVVFLSGDLHFSSYIPMDFIVGDKSIRVHQIIASGFYSPIPFANAKPDELASGDYDLPDGGLKINFGKVELLSEEPSHFLHVEISPKTVDSVDSFELTARAYDPIGRRGDSLQKLLR